MLEHKTLDYILLIKHFLVLIHEVNTNNLELFLLKERSDGGGTMSRLFECMSVRNKRHRFVTK